jgi:hypothetical protein
VLGRVQRGGKLGLSARKPVEVFVQSAVRRYVVLARRAGLNNPTEKIYPPYMRARSWYRPGGPRLAQLKSLDD